MLHILQCKGSPLFFGHCPFFGPFKATVFSVFSEKVEFKMVTANFLAFFMYHLLI